MQHRGRRGCVTGDAAGSAWGNVGLGHLLERDGSRDPSHRNGIATGRSELAESRPQAHSRPLPALRTRCAVPSCRGVTHQAGLPGDPRRRAHLTRLGGFIRLLESRAGWDHDVLPPSCALGQRERGSRRQGASSGSDRAEVRLAWPLSPCALGPVSWRLTASLALFSKHGASRKCVGSSEEDETEA